MKGWKLTVVSFAVCTGAVLLACQDTTAPSLGQRVAGTYDVTTTLRTYTYSESCVSGVCTNKTVPSGPATLTGTLTIADSVVSDGSGGTRFPVYSATFHEAPCVTSVPRCTGATNDRTIEYGDSHHNFTVTGDTLGVGGVLFNIEMIAISGTFAGDSIVGRVGWSPYLGVATERYDGAFVARRQP